MTKPEILERVCAILEETKGILDETGENGRTPITPETVPIKDIAGFDSMIGVSVTISIMTALEVDKEDITSLFVKKKSCEPASVSEVVDELFKLKESS